MPLLKRFYPYVIILVFSLVLFFPNLNNTTLFDWDEINFAEASREMIINGDYSKVTINYIPFWEKPPLFFWLQAASMNVFGINEFAARLPNAVFGIITLLTLFLIGKYHFDNKMGWLWVMIYTGSFFPQFYFMMGMIDPVFNYFIFLGIYFLFRFSNDGRFIDAGGKKSSKWIFLSGLFTGFAILTKGPVAFLIVILVIAVYWLLKRKEFNLRFIELFYFIIVAFIVSTAWFGIETFRNGFFFLREFIIYQIRLFSTQDAGHGGPFYYHFVIILIGLFPASILAIKGFKKIQYDSKAQKSYHTWMVILFWVVLILFSIVKTKIVHYSSLAYFPVTFLAAYFIYNVINNKSVWGRWIDWVVTVTSVLMTIVVISLPLLFKYKESWIDKVSDDFATALIMKPVVWTGFETIAFILLPAGVLIFFLIRRKYKDGLYVGAITLFAVYAIGINISLKTFSQNIDLHLQKDIVDFYKSIQYEDVYCDVVGFKSYAHLFYTFKKNPENKNSLDSEWLLNGEIDKSVYFVSKSQNIEKTLKENPNIRFLKRVGGYLVYYRDSVKK